jgi:hypothetical protein
MTAGGVWTHALDNASQIGGARLTGSSGDDVFVYLAAAVSNSIQFDTITDFKSGADKINLAAFGALAFLHLEPTSTTVPAHTLAWIYDSASNETIVYVNPTDGALDIGDSALLEVHLQGVASVDESNFSFEKPAATTTQVAASETIDPALEAIAAAATVVLASASADVSADTADGVSAHATGSGWALQAADESFKFLFDGDTETIGSVRLAHFDKASAYATAASDGDAVVTLASGSATELWHDSTTTHAEDHFTFHQGPNHASASAVASGEPGAMASASAIEQASLMVANAVAESQLATHEVTTESGASTHQSQHELHTSQHAESVEPEEAGHAQASVAHAHGAGPHGPAAAQETEAAALPLAQEHATANAEIVEEPGQESSFHFKNEVAASHHTELVELEEVVPARAPVTHGHGGGPSPSLEMEIAALSPAEEHAAAHAQVVQPHVASHGSHDLIV